MSISVDDQAFKEWKECRSTIARMDTILEDLRKFGFTLVTGLLTANAFLGGPVSGRAGAGVAATIAIMALVTILFAVDTYYSAGLSGAVERALDLELATAPHIRITRYISENRMAALSNWVTVGLYLVLLLVATGLGVATAMAATPAATLVGVTAGIGLLMMGAMVGYYWLVNDRSGMNRRKSREWPEDPPAQPAKATQAAAPSSPDAEPA